MNYTATATIMTLTQVSDGSTATKSATRITNAVIGAYGVPVKFSDSDRANVLEKPLDPERFNNARLTYGPTVIASGHHRLSLGARASLGVGACCAVGLLVFGALLLWSKKRSCRAVQSALGEKAAQAGAFPASPISIVRRKPLASEAVLSAPSIHDSDTSGRYQAVSTAEDATEGVKPKAQFRRKVSDDIFLWKWEILSLFISILSLLSIIIVLYVYENRLLEEWTALVSINAVVSILSAIFKGSLALPVSEGKLHNVSTVIRSR